MVHVYQNFHVRGTKTYETLPSSCPYCGGSDVSPVEILGAYDGPVMWECFTCEEFLLRFSKEKTKRYLEKTRDLFIDFDEEALSNIWRERPN